VGYRPAGTLKVLKSSWFRIEMGTIPLTSVMSMSKEDLVSSSTACVHSCLCLYDQI
uniref:Uncharacterized protein n=1 Tax=Castor canadensis TaxID=51338 RepID=A0A8C0ZRZ1_CASCN